MSLTWWFPGSTFACSQNAWLRARASNVLTRRDELRHAWSTIQNWTFGAVRGSSGAIAARAESALFYV
jgi:hypothetical protein